MGLGRFLKGFAWRKLTRELDDLFYNARHNWYSEIFEAVSNPDTWPDSIEGATFSIKHKRLAGEADLATKALQLYLTSSLVATKQYVQPSDGKDFADALYSEVLGNEIKKAETYVSSFRKHGTDYASLAIEFGSIISPHAFAGSSVGPGTMLIAAYAERLFLLTLVAVAAAFDDGETAAQFARDAKVIRGK